MWRAILVLLVLAPSEAFGFKPAPPTRHDVPSPNGAFVIDVDPIAKRNTVFATDSRDKPLWSWDGGVWGEHFLSNDGKVVALVTWRFVTVNELATGACVEFWDRTGRFRTYTFAELCAHPSRILGTGPVGDSWREWYSGAMGDGDTVQVRTTDEFEYVFSMEDGRILQTIRVREPKAIEETLGASGFLGLPWSLWWILPATGFTVAGLLVALRLRRARSSRPGAMTF
jgi:hypothetical protein